MAPKNKGIRDAMMTRPPLEVGQIIRARALRADVPYGDYISAILSEYVGLSHLMPMPPVQDIFDVLKDTTVPLEENELPRTA